MWIFRRSLARRRAPSHSKLSSGIWRNRAYLSLTTVIMCCIDGLAADPWNAGKFEAYLRQNLAELCCELEIACANRNGAGILYEPGCSLQ
jgi:hypothetical protein